MPLNQTVSFLYNAQLAGLSIERINLDGPTILSNLKTWVHRDRLNKLKTFTVVVVKNNIDLNKIYIERDVFIPGFGFKGIITGLRDIDDNLLKITIHERAWHFTRRKYKIEDNFKEYNIALVGPASLSTLLQGILTSANADMPLTWILGEDIPATSDFDFDIKWKNYYELLQLIAKHTINDLWFEGNRVYLGTKGKSVTLERVDKIYEKLSTTIDLDTYGNIVTVVGAEVGGTNVYSTASNVVTDLLYNYEKVISNNNFKDQISVDGVSDRILDEIDTIEPDVTIAVSESIINKYDLESGDIIKINSNSETQTVKGFYRIIEVTTSNSTSALKLQFSKTGKALPRISDSLDLLSAILTKIHELELNS